LGILAHVDAGKTTLTERLLHAAGVIDEIGSVDDGTTQTDTLALERQRGITIKSAVVSFVIDDITVNLIDTPGHPDFIAEVERVLSVLDGAVLVISAVEGVQAQTRILTRALQRLRIPTLFFVNKIDRTGAQYERVLRSISERLTPAIIPMGSVRGLGTRNAICTPHGAGDADFTARLVELIADRDDAVLAAYVDDETTVSYRRLRRELARQTGDARAHPVFFGSAMTGAGVDALIAGITELLPSAGGDVDGPVSGSVFKVERGPAGEKIAYVRMFSGTVRTRDRLTFGRGDKGRVSAISVFDRGSAIRRESVAAGQIGKLWGLADIRIGDAIGPPRRTTEHHFAPPTLETVILPRRPADKGALHVALAQLTEQDPLINLRQDDTRHETYVSLYGEVQKEVIEATLANDFHIPVEFRETTTIHIERLIGSGAAVETLDSPSNPFRAGVGLRVEPGPIDSGVEFRLEIEPGSLPVPFRKAVEETVRETLRQGIYGWQVADCTVAMTHSGYIPPQGKRGQAFDASISSTAGDFRNLTPLVLMSAVQEAGTSVYEPMHRFRLEIPEDTLAATLPVLAGLRAAPRTQELLGSSYVLHGEIAAARVNDLQQRLPALTRGEGVLECTFSHYRRMDGTVPSRERTDHNPLNRKEYLLHVVRRVQGARAG
jgi:ribosomal protection tetracycline resistance protein